MRSSDPFASNTAFRSPTAENFTSYLQESFLNRVFFHWINKFIQMNEVHPFKQDMHYTLHRKDRSRAHFDKLSTKWEEKKKQTQRFSLLKSIFAAYNFQFLVIVALDLVKIVLFFS